MKSASILVIAACLLPVLGPTAALGGPAPSTVESPAVLTATIAMSSAAGASETVLQHILPDLYVPIRRCNDCQAVRTARWIRSLTGDRARVFAETGFPVFRYREDMIGQVFEYWTYPSRHRTYVFQGDRLLRIQPY
jgi:hypothetical protein